MHQLVGEFRDGEGLQPNPAWASQSSKKYAVSTENHVLNPRNPGDLKGNAGLEGSHVAWMDTQCLSGRQILHDQLSRQLDPTSAHPGHLLQQKPVSAEDSGTQGLLETDTELNLGRSAEKTMAMYQVLHARTHLHRLNVPRNPCSKGDLATTTHGAVFGHEQASSASHSFQRAEESTTPAELGVGLHLDGTTHPGKLTSFGNDGLVGLQNELENRQGSTDDTALHGRLLLESVGTPVYSDFAITWPILSWRGVVFFERKPQEDRTLRPTAIAKSLS
jgi:hypothetical protein